jgi:hypothetical protein
LSAAHSSGAAKRTSMKRTEPAGMPADTSTSVTGCRRASMADRTEGCDHTHTARQPTRWRQRQRGVSAAAAQGGNAQRDAFDARAPSVNVLQATRADGTRARQRRSREALRNACATQRLRARAGRTARARARPQGATHESPRNEACARSERRQLRPHPPLAARKRPPRRRRCRQPTIRRCAMLGTCRAGGSLPLS